MQSVSIAFERWYKHTKVYYNGIYSMKGVRFVAVCIVFLCVSSSIVITQASVAKWNMKDVLNLDIIQGKYDFLRSADAPAESNNTYHLAMPMMLEDYLNPSVYGELFEGIRMTTEPGFYDPNALQAWGDEERVKAADDATEFIKNRPPKAISD